MMGNNEKKKQFAYDDRAPKRDSKEAQCMFVSVSRDDSYEKEKKI